jgi:hypothetical protein
MKKYLQVWISVLLFGLIIHFIWINFLQFVVGIGKPWITVLSLRKEIVILWLCVWVIVYNLKAYGIAGYRKNIKKDRFFYRLLMWFLALVVITVISSLFNGSFGKAYIIAARYNFVPFLLLLLWYQLSQIIDSLYVKRITSIYAHAIKWIIWLSLVWYFVISTLPGALRIFWYDRHVYEGKLGEQPPAVYYAALDHGAPRNQFLWERPIYFGFYLVAFRPLFFFLVIRREKKSEQILYSLLFISAVFTTFSRSARWVWIIETVLILLLVYGKQFFKYFKYLIIPVIGFGFLVGTYFYYEIFGPGRKFSNTGHINAFFDSLTILSDHRLRWNGAWSAGPASHQLGIWFNPENQYLQIWIEYGVFGFLFWLCYYGFLNISWIIRWWRNSVSNLVTKWSFADIRNRDTHKLVLLSCNIWLLSLSVCGLVLHSLADRMVIRPLMLIYGLWLGVKLQK